MNKRIIILSTVLIAGCQQMQPQQLANSGPTMRQIYQQQLDSNSSVNTNRYANTYGSLSSKILRHSNTIYSEDIKLDVEDFPFKRVNNPDIPLYIFPYITAKQKIPVNGVKALFPLYTNIHYQYQ